MPYIGKEPIVGNFQKCDALTASGTADYTLQVSSTNVVPESANHMLVSLNGVIQQPGASGGFTVSGSTLSFNSALTSSDPIDFVILLGNVLDIGTPSDGTVTNAKLGTDVISGETDIGGALADADLFLVDDGAGGTLRKTAASRLKTYIGGTTPAFSAYSADNQTISDATWTKVELDTEEYDSDGTFATHRFTPAVAGYYFIYGRFNIDTAHNTAGAADCHVAIHKNGSSYTSQQQRWLGYPQRNPGVQCSAVLSLDDDDYVELYAYCDDGQDSPVIDGTAKQTWFTGFKV